MDRLETLTEGMDSGEQGTDRKHVTSAILPKIVFNP